MTRHRATCLSGSTSTFINNKNNYSVYCILSTALYRYEYLMILLRSTRDTGERVTLAVIGHAQHGAQRWRAMMSFASAVGSRYVSNSMYASVRCIIRLTVHTCMSIPISIMCVCVCVCMSVDATLKLRATRPLGLRICLYRIPIYRVYIIRTRIIRYDNEARSNARVVVSTGVQRPALACAACRVVPRYNVARTDGSTHSEQPIGSLSLPSRTLTQRNR